VTIRTVEVPAREGRAVVVRAGETLRIIDVAGAQVADLVAFAESDEGEWLSSGRSFDYNQSLRPKTGYVLYSNRGQAMAHIVSDDVGRHDWLYMPCSREMFRRQYEVDDSANCLDNLVAALRPWGVGADRIPTPLNLFMRVDIATDGGLTVLPPASRPGDAVALCAEMDLVVAVSACSAPSCCGGECSEIRLEVEAT
jgi:uncharacterized protein YcgI (DUF1989 family)